MEKYLGPKVPLDLEPLRYASGSVVLSFGMVVVDGKLVNHFTVEADSSLLTVLAKEDHKTEQALVVRHGEWLAISADLSSKYSRGTTLELEAIKTFLVTEAKHASSDRPWPRRIGNLIIRRLRKYWQ